MLRQTGCHPAVNGGVGKDGKRCLIELGVHRRSQFDRARACGKRSIGCVGVGGRFCHPVGCLRNCRNCFGCGPWHRSRHQECVARYPGYHGCINAS